MEPGHSTAEPLLLPLASPFQTQTVAGGDALSAHGCPSRTQRSLAEPRSSLAMAQPGSSCFHQLLPSRSGLYVVGPESAGAHPGPACYRKGECQRAPVWYQRVPAWRQHPHCAHADAGGPLTVTDANLCLGRLLPEFFPRIFGPGEDQPLCREAAARAFRELAATIHTFHASADAAATPQPLSVEEVAMGFVRVANEAMCRPIRALTQVGWHQRVEGTTG